jgi:hypothetical protein
LVLAWPDTPLQGADNQGRRGFCEDTINPSYRGGKLRAKRPAGAEFMCIVLRFHIAFVYDASGAEVSNIMISWIKNVLSQPAPQQVEVIEQREPSLEERLERILSRSQGIKSQSDDDLAELVQDIDAVLSILESALNILDNRDLDMRAKRLRTRLRKVRTRADRARAA